MPRMLVFLVGIMTAMALSNHAADTDGKDAKTTAPQRTTLQPGDRFADFDRNGDGVITRDEFASGDLFDEIDANGDGKVTRGEAVIYAIRQRRQDREEAAAAAKTMTVTRDVVYIERKGSDPEFTSLDIYAPKKAKDCPVMIFIHGGGWRIGDKRNSALTKSKYFTEAGYVYVTINYRLTPKVQHPEHVRDVAAAIAWTHDHIRKHGGDPERIFIMGHSAGAHLAGLVATDHRRLKEHGKPLSTIKGTILLDGAGYDIPRTIRFSGKALASTYEAAFTDEAGKQRDASPFYHVEADKDIPPFLIVHVADRALSRWQSDHLAGQLKKAKVQAHVHAAQDKNHMTLNRDIGVDEDSPTKVVRTFLDTRLREIAQGRTSAGQAGEGEKGSRNAPSGHRISTNGKNGKESGESP